MSSWRINGQCQSSVLTDGATVPPGVLSYFVLAVALSLNLEAVYTPHLLMRVGPTRLLLVERKELCFCSDLFRTLYLCLLAKPREKLSGDSTMHSPPCF